MVADDEIRLDITRIKDEYARFRDEIVPAFERDFPDCVIVLDECVVTTSFPDPDAWRGGKLSIIGIEKRTAYFIIDALFLGRETRKPRMPWTMKLLDDIERLRVSVHRARRAVRSRP